MYLKPMADGCVRRPVAVRVDPLCWDRGLEEYPKLKLLTQQ